MSGSEATLRGACPEIGQAQLMEIADNLLNEVVRLREENKRLKEEVATLKMKANDEELWEVWENDDPDCKAECFDEFKHSVREHERILFWRLDQLEWRQRGESRQQWRHHVQWGNDFLTPRDRWLHEQA